MLIVPENRIRRARRELATLRALAGAAFALLSLVGLTGAANAPDFGETLPVLPVSAQASLARTGTDVIITGSIDHMFNSGGFVGPNRSDKQDRMRPTEDLMALTSGFADIRARIAMLRNPEAAKTKLAPAAPTMIVEDTPIAVASIDPDMSSAALDAIDALSHPDGAPVPQLIPEKLAYARADLPATVFDGAVRDTKGNKVSDKEVWCMATAIYFEARGEAYRGQVAVGQVVMNRVAHRLYPSTICGVVFQNQNKRNACQFSFACDGIPERVTEKKAWDQAMEIAKLVIPATEYIADVGMSTHYHATYVYPHWARKMKKNTKIGLHVFYQFKSGWKFG
ncbi:cell wall hydrolase [Devosia sp.]|uniref:cell wall hydrolase n=1 Tax=Devosia sp. TaxID=1871048 RepID=UPI003A95719C